MELTNKQIKKSLNFSCALRIGLVMKRYGWKRLPRKYKKKYKKIEIKTHGYIFALLSK